MVNDVDTVFSVDSLAVHPQYSLTMGMSYRKNCLVTGGGNQVVSFWDYKSKRRVSQLTGFPNAISSMDFNADGSVLAIASSYLYENGKQAYS